MSGDAKKQVKVLFGAPELLIPKEIFKSRLKKNLSFFGKPSDNKIVNSKFFELKEKIWDLHKELRKAVDDPTERVERHDPALINTMTNIKS